MSSRRTTLSAMLLALAAGTAGGQQTPIRGNETPVWRNPRLLEELRIGVLEGDVNYIFGPVENIVVGKDGAIFVLDGPNRRIRMYDVHGKFVRAVGKTGAGPGEFRGPVGMAITPKGDLAVWDVELGRVTLFSAKGDFLRSFNHRGNYFRGDDLRVDTAGNFWIYNGKRIPGPREASLKYFVRVTPQGRAQDTLWLPHMSEERGGFVIMTSEGNLQPFPVEAVSALSPLGYLVTGITNTYKLDIVRSKGPQITIISRQFTPVRLRPEEKAEWEARARFYDRRGGASAGTVIKSVKPAFRKIAVGDDGRIWVDRYTEARKRPITSPPDAPPPLTWRDARAFDVFERDGRFLGTVVPPENSVLFARRGNYVWGVHRGDLDVPYVVRFRIDPGR